MTRRTASTRSSRRERAGGGLSSERVIEAATELLESSPSTPLTLTAVARRLGVSTMSLYTYVENREELVARAMEGVLGTFRAVLREGDPWDRQLVELLRQMRSHVHRHPFLALAGPTGAVVVSPGMVEALVGVVAGAGFASEELGIVTQWLARVFWGQILLEMQYPPPGPARMLYARSHEAPGDGASRIEEVFRSASNQTADEAFEFSVGRIVAALEDLRLGRGNPKPAAARAKKSGGAASRTKRRTVKGPRR